MSELAGTIGGYVVLGEIARGGEGLVLRAEDPRLGRAVAIKLLLPGRKDSTDRKRFVRESRALAHLRHPHVVAIHAAGEHEGRPYLVLDLVEGESLESRLRRGPLPPREAVSLLVGVADALAYAHGRNVIHRDVKPDNVLLRAQDGIALLTDFGLVKQIDSTDTRLSKSGALMGTPGYWPPEQATGDLSKIGPASDVYAFGATLYATLTGGPPHRGRSLVEHVIATVDAAPDPPSAHAPTVDRALDAIVLRCLAKQPEERYASGAELVQALHAWLNGVTQLEGAVAPSWVFAAAGMVVVGALAIGFGFGVNARSDAAALAGAKHGEPSPSAVPRASPPPSTSPTPTPTRRRPPKRTSPPDPEDLRRVDELMQQAQRAIWTKQHERALDFLGEAIKIDPGRADLYSARGDALQELKQSVKALADFEMAVQLQPNNPVFRRRLGYVLATRGEQKRALRHYDMAIKWNPAFAKAFKERGDIYSRLGRLDEAVADFRVALEKASPYSATRRKVSKSLKLLEERIERERVKAPPPKDSPSTGSPEPQR